MESATIMGRVYISQRVWFWNSCCGIEAVEVLMHNTYTFKEIKRTVSAISPCKGSAIASRYLPPILYNSMILWIIWLSVDSKIFDILFLGRLLPYLKSNMVLISYQNRFRMGRWILDSIVYTLVQVFTWWRIICAYYMIWQKHLVV